MSDAPGKILDWGRIYQDLLTTEILRSERRRVTILAGLFAFAACVYSFFAYMPGILVPEFRVRFQTQGPVDHLSLRSGSSIRLGTARGNWLADRASTPALRCRSLLECVP